MKNKKLINIYMLSISLFAIITFLLPLQKISEESIMTNQIIIIFKIINIIILVLLLLIILLSLINLFTDNYETLKFMQALSYFSFIMGFINVLIFSGSINLKLSSVYIVAILLLFINSSFYSLYKIKISIKGITKYIKKIVNNIKNKIFKTNNDVPTLKTTLQLKKLQKQEKVVKEALEDNLSNDSDNDSMGFSSDNDNMNLNNDNQNDLK